MKLNKAQAEVIIQSWMSEWASKEMDSLNGLNVKKEIWHLEKKIQGMKTYQQSLVN